MNELAKKIIRALNDRGHTLSIAESVTGGLVAAAITEIPGASKVFSGSIVAYSALAKREELDIPQELLNQYSLVSPEVAFAMAKGVQGRFETDWAISTTGAAGPDPLDGAPVGLICCAIIGPDTVLELAIELNGSREEIRRGAVTALLSELARILSSTI
jgi:nicotinamide-nucleotide amidase